MEELDILEFLKYYWSKIVLVLVCITVGLLGSLVFTLWLQVPVYLSQTSLVLTNNENASTSITTSDISLNKNLVSTYRQIVKSRRILDQVIKNLQLDIDYETLNKQIEVTNIADTEIIVISVRNEDNVLAQSLANEIANVFKNEIVEIYNIENVSIIDTALISEVPDNVHVARQYFIGMILGFILSTGFIVFSYFIDDTLKKKEDIEEKLGLSVLGTVPVYKKKMGVK